MLASSHRQHAQSNVAPYEHRFLHSHFAQDVIPVPSLSRIDGSRASLPAIAYDRASMPLLSLLELLVFTPMSMGESSAQAKLTNTH